MDVKVTKINIQTRLIILLEGGAALDSGEVDGLQEELLRAYARESELDSILSSEVSRPRHSSSQHHRVPGTT